MTLSVNHKDILDSSEAEDDEVEVNIRYDISSYGVDFLLDGLISRIENKDIIIPEFQREYVWSPGQASRFIESIMLDLPVPGIFLSKDSKNVLKVIDGQQRLKTICYFKQGLLRGKVFKLTGVNKQYEDLTYETFSEEDRRHFMNYSIHATVIKQDKPEDGQSSIFLVFERLNTGGTALSSQEIRSCVYHGKFCELLKSLNQNVDWRKLYKIENKRAKDQELILRFFALFYDLSKYKRPMKSFLGDFMESNIDLARYSADTLSVLFENTVSFLIETIGSKGFRPDGPLNVAVTDALLVATALRMQKGQILNRALFKERCSGIIKNESFRNSCKNATSNVENVVNRISLAKEAFEDIE